MWKIGPFRIAKKIFQKDRRKQKHALAMRLWLVVTLTLKDSRASEGENRPGTTKRGSTNKRWLPTNFNEKKMHTSIYVRCSIARSWRIPQNSQLGAKISNLIFLTIEWTGHLCTYLLGFLYYSCHDNLSGMTAVPTGHSSYSGLQPVWSRGRRCRVGFPSEPRISLLSCSRNLSFPQRPVSPAWFLRCGGGMLWVAPSTQSTGFVRWFTG